MKEKTNKEMTGYASIDKPNEIGASYFERNPIIPNMNIYSLLKLISVKNLDNSAVDCLDLKATYKQLLNDSKTVSIALKQLGVKEGDIVSISMPNLYQSLISFFACNRIGATATFLDYSMSQKETIEYLNRFESPVLINYDKPSDYNENIKNNSQVKYIVTLKNNKINLMNLNQDLKTFGKSRFKFDFIDFNSLGKIAASQKIKLEKYHSSKENALILFTSGTTGNPKSVVLTNKNVLAAEIYAMNTSHTENIKVKKTLTCVPFSYPYGFVTSALTSLLWGKEAILAPVVDKSTISYYYSKKPNIIFGSPALLELTMKNIDKEMDLSFVTHFISGGDFLTAQNAKRGIEFFKSHGANVEVGNGFGNAETVSIGSTPVGVPLRIETAGKILVGSKAIVVDPETMEEKKYHEEGTLFVAGDHVFKEYYKAEEATAKAKKIINGVEYFNTETLGFIDEYGYFTPTGRQSRFYIMSSLNKVYCDKIQSIISTFKEIGDCAIVKVPDSELLYVNKAYIVLNPEYSNLENKEEYVNSLFYTPTVLNGRVTQLKSYEIPTYIEFVDSLPRRKGTDKIDYQLLEKDALEKLSDDKNIKVKKMEYK